MKNQKFIAMLLALVMVLSLTACGTAAPAADTKSAEAAQMTSGTCDGLARTSEVMTAWGMGV